MREPSQLLSLVTPILMIYRVTCAGAGKHIYLVNYWELANSRAVSLHLPPLSRSSLPRSSPITAISTSPTLLTLPIVFITDGFRRPDTLLRRPCRNKNLHRTLLHAPKLLHVKGVDDDAQDHDRHPLHLRNRHDLRDRIPMSAAD